MARTASIAAGRGPKTSARVRSSVRRSRPAASTSYWLWSRAPAATLGCASCIRIAHVPARVTADSRLTRQRTEWGPNSPGSSFRLPDAIDASLAAGQRDDIHYMEAALGQGRAPAPLGGEPVGAP